MTGDTRAVNRPGRVRDVSWFPDFGRPGVYLASLVGVPVALVLIAWRPVDVPEWMYGFLILAAGVGPLFMAQDAAASLGRKEFSWWVARAQVWLHLGGAVG